MPIADYNITFSDEIKAFPVIDFEYKKSEFQIERSLLQKALRRADSAVVEKTVLYLLDQGNKTWLRNRLYVMAYEECWPFAHQMQTDDLVKTYVQLACTVKTKMPGD